MSGYVSGAEDILLTLRQCATRGNIIGVFLKENTQVYLTAVDNIIYEGGSNIVVLKKPDLLGSFHFQNKIPLHLIEKIRSFRALYEDRLPLTIKKIAYSIESEHPVKIRKRERAIDSDDLKMILIKSIDSGYRINITLKNGTCVSECYVRDFVFKSNKIIISCGIDQGEKNTVDLDSIKSIQFETFFHYKGMSSKIFTT